MQAQQVEQMEMLEQALEAQQQAELHHPTGAGSGGSLVR